MKKILYLLILVSSYTFGQCVYNQTSTFDSSIVNSGGILLNGVLTTGKYLHNYIPVYNKILAQFSNYMDWTDSTFADLKGGDPIKVLNVDWDEIDNVVGIPLETNATIEIYGNGFTVFELFENDWEDTLFVKYATRGDYGVAENITIYSESLTGGELSVANNYFTNLNYSIVNLIDLTAYWSSYYENNIDSLEFIASGNTITNINSETVTMSGGTYQIGSSIQLNSNNYAIVDTGATDNVIILNTTPSASVTDELYLGVLPSFTDQSNNSNDALQSTDARKPTILNLSNNDVIAYFDKTDDYCDISNQISFDDIDKWSISMWLKPEYNSSMSTIIGGGNTFFWIKRTNQLFNIGFSNANSDDVYIVTVDELFDNNLHNLVITTDCDNIYVYIDGEFVGSHEEDGTTAIDLSYFGKGTISTAYHYLGLMDDIKIYNRELSENQIEYDYQNSRLYWSNLAYHEPFMQLPDTMYIMTGDTMIIQDDGIATKMIGQSDLEVSYICEVGTKISGGYEFNEVVSDVGYYPFLAKAYIDGVLKNTKSCVVNVFEPAVSATSIDVLMIGNSLTNSKPTVDSVRTVVSGGDVTLYGTQGIAPNLHEGNSGYWIESYTTDAKIVQDQRNPFWDGSKFNFSESYRPDSLGAVSPLDIIYLQLGTNPITLNYWDEWSYIYDSYIDNMKLMVDSILDDGTGIVIIAMPPICVNSAAKWIAAYGTGRDQNMYIKKVHSMYYILNKEFSGGRYAGNVYVSPQGLFVNRDTESYSDALHLNEKGYWQLSKPLISLIEYIIKYKL